jgi:hypothetical protein
MQPVTVINSTEARTWEPPSGQQRRLLARGMRLPMIDVFVDEVLAELEAMAKDGARPMRSRPKPPLAAAALRKAGMAIWCVCFCGTQWRAIGLLCEIPFGTLYGLFARWTRLGPELFWFNGLRHFPGNVLHRHESVTECGTYCAELAVSFGS